MKVIRLVLLKQMGESGWMMQLLHINASSRQILCFRWVSSDGGEVCGCCDSSCGLRTDGAFKVPGTLCM